MRLEQTRVAIDARAVLDDRAPDVRRHILLGHEAVPASGHLAIQRANRAFTWLVQIDVDLAGGQDLAGGKESHLPRRFEFPHVRFPGRWLVLVDQLGEELIGYTPLCIRGRHQFRH